MLRLLNYSVARMLLHPGRTLLSVLAIALGVALGFGVHLVNRAAVGELEAAVRAVAGEADLQVRGGRGGFPQALYAQVARLPEVEFAAPVLELDVGLADGGRTLRLIGIDPLRAAAIQPAMFAADPMQGFALLRGDRVLLSQLAAERLALGAGGRITVIVGLERVSLEVAGVLPAGALAGVAALVDVAAAQWRLARPGELNRIDLRLTPGVEAEAARARIAALLPAGVHVDTPESVAAASADPSRAYRVNLNVLALVALFTGGFLVFSAQALEMTRRRGEHALLRVLGLEGRALARLVLAEAALLGLAGALIGILLGYGFAAAAIGVLGGDLGAGMFRGLAPRLSFDLLAAAGYAAAGVLIALAGALLPALDAAAQPPARALKAGDEIRMFERLTPAWPGVVLIAAGTGAAQLGPVGGLPLFGYVSIACLLIGSIALMPRVARAAFGAWPFARSPVSQLAAAQLRGSPGQAMVSLAAVVASFALMAAMAIMVSSFRGSVAQWLDAVLPADLYFRTTHAGETAYLDPSFESAVRALPQVARAEFLRSARVSLDARRPAVSLLAREFPEGDARRALPLVSSQAVRGDDRMPRVWVSEAVADAHGMRPGDRLSLPLGGAVHEVMVDGVWRDYARQHGAIVIARADYIALTGDRRSNDASLWLAPGASADDAMRALRALPGGDALDMATPGEIRKVSLRIFDRSFAVTYAIEAVAVIVGLFGLSSSIGAMVLSRRREFGVLRHIGVTRGQIGRMLAIEGTLIAALGAAVGLAVGAAISLVLVFVVNRQSFGWSMDLHVPVATLATLALVMVALGSLTAVWSGREATGAGPVRAVREDW